MTMSNALTPEEQQAFEAAKRRMKGAMREFGPHVVLTAIPLAIEENYGHDEASCRLARRMLEAMNAWAHAEEPETEH